MSDPDKPIDDPKPGKGRRRSATIDLTAEEIRTSPETASEAAAEASSNSDFGASAEPAAVVGERTEPQAEEPAATPIIEPEAHAAEAPVNEAASRVEPLNVPPAPEPEKPSMALPLVAVAAVGVLFGGLGGALVPTMLGGNNADSARIDILERTQQQFAKDQSGLASTAELEKVRQAVAKLEATAAQPAPQPAAGAAAATPALEGRIAELESGLKALANRPTPETPAQAPAAPPVDLNPLRTQITALQGRLSDLDAAANERRELQAKAEAIDGQVKALDAAIKDLAGRVEGATKAAEAAPRAAAQTVTAAIDPKIAAIGQRVEQAEAKIESGRAAPLFAAVQALAQTFHRGAPFASELTATEALGAPTEQTQLLRPFAERGAPTPQRLQDSFAQLAGRLAGDTSQPGVMGYVSRFVTIRPTEESASATPAAIVGSIEAALRRNDVAAAVANWNRLPESARTASSEWGAQATRRAAAAKALADMQAAAAAALRK